jgi:protein-tyrosine kinase
MGKFSKALKKSDAGHDGSKLMDMEDNFEASLLPENDSVDGDLDKKSFQDANKSPAEPVTSKNKNHTPMDDSGKAELSTMPVQSKKPPAKEQLSEPERKGMQAWDERILTAVESSSQVVEHIKRLRNKILHPENGKIIKSIMVTSVMPGEGKSFIAVNLGVSLALGIEQHALILDCDLRRPSLAPLFGINNDQGLVDYLRHEVDIVDILKQTGLAKLTVIPSGPVPVNPSELLNSSKMIAVIDELVNRYNDRFIIIDTPPMVAAAETAILAKHVDGVVLIVRSGTSPREQVKQLVEQIGRGKIIGVVFNGFQHNMLDKMSNKKNQYQYLSYKY